VLAWRLDDELSKEEIRQHYPNTVPFGRGAYGIEAAAQAYFGRSVDVASKNQITVSEAMVLVAMVEQPEPVEGAPASKSKPSYDTSGSRSATDQLRCPLARSDSATAVRA
jgi:membrane carboxypeptidase/penicillin-binding protein